MADALASGVSARKGVRVQVPPRARKDLKLLKSLGLFLYFENFKPHRWFTWRGFLWVNFFLYDRGAPKGAESVVTHRPSNLNRLAPAEEVEHLSGT